MGAYTLTIAIPTYNRPRQLEHTLSVVYPQVLAHGAVQLVILDNCSTVPASEVLRRVTGAAALPDSVKIIRHPYNIGADANILRSFEVAEGEYLWCLGDDDDPGADAVETILSDVRRDRFCYAYYGLSSEFPMLRDVEEGRLIGSSVTEWVKRTPDYGKRLFISESVFRLADVRPYLHIAYRAAAGGAAHLTMAFLAVLGGGRYLLSSRQIAAYNPPEEGTGYNCVPYAYGSAYLLSLVGDKCSAKDFDAFYSRGFSGWVMPSLLLRQAIILHKGASRHLCEGFSLIAKYFKPRFASSPRLWAKWTLCQILSKVPTIAGRVFSCRVRLQGKKLNVVDGRVS